MIIDLLENLEKYASLNPLFPKIIAFIQQHNLETLEPKVYEVEGKDAFVNVQVAQGRSAEDALLESHRAMIDIQIPLEVEETFGYEPTALLPEMPYDSEKDISFYGEKRTHTLVKCKPGMFVIFFPQDAHAPLISPEKEFKKAIVKCKVESVTCNV